MKTKWIIFVFVVAAILLGCAQQPPVIVVQPAPQQAPQQQQQQQTVIIQQQPNPEPQVVPQAPQPDLPDYWRPCDTLPESHLRVGDRVHVSAYSDLRNRMRIRPDHNGRIVAMAPTGTEFRILDGPYCDPGWYIYWKVQVLYPSQLEDKVQGWRNYDLYTAETDTTGTPWLVR